MLTMQKLFTSISRILLLLHFSKEVPNITFSQASSDDNASPPEDTSFWDSFIAPDGEVAVPLSSEHGVANVGVKNRPSGGKVHIDDATRDRLKEDVIEALQDAQVEVLSVNVKVHSSNQGEHLHELLLTVCACLKDLWKAFELPNLSIYNLSIIY